MVGASDGARAETDAAPGYAGGAPTLDRRFARRRRLLRRRPYPSPLLNRKTQRSAPETPRERAVHRRRRIHPRRLHLRLPTRPLRRQSLLHPLAPLASRPAKDPRMLTAPRPAHGRASGRRRDGVAAALAARRAPRTAVVGARLLTASAPARCPSGPAPE